MYSWRFRFIFLHAFVEEQKSEPAQYGPAPFGAAWEAPQEVCMRLCKQEYTRLHNEGYNSDEAHAYVEEWKEPPPQREWDAFVASSLQPSLIEAKKKIADGCNLHVLDARHGCTPLYTACSQGRLDMVQVLLDAGADVNRGDIDGVAPICTAAGKGHVEIVRTLLDTGADPNRGSWHGCALNWAAAHQRIKVMHLLLDHGANPISKDGRGNTPRMQWLGHTDHCEAFEDMLQRLQAEEATWQEIHTACQQGGVSTVKKLLDRGIDVDRPNEQGQRPLDLALALGHIDVLEVVLDAKPCMTRMIEGDQGKERRHVCAIGTPQERDRTSKLLCAAYGRRWLAACTIQKWWKHLRARHFWQALGRHLYWKPGGPGAERTREQFLGHRDAKKECP